MSKPAETDTPLFGTTSDVLETAARSPVPSASNTAAAPPASSGDFFSSASASSSESKSSNGSNGTGARNENSALFSLAQLSGGEEKHEQKAHSDSSIIDIKALATGGSSLGAILGDGGGLASPLAGPVLAPVAAPTLAALPSEKPAKSNNTVIVSVLGASIILVGGGLGAAMIMRTAPAATTINAERSSSPSTTPTVEAQPTTPDPQPAQQAPAPGSAPATNTPTSRASEGGGRARSRSSSSTASTRANSEPAPQVAAPPTAPTTTVSPCVRNCRGDIPCILRCASGGGGSNSAEPAPRTSGGLAETPARGDIIAAMGRVRSAVSACATGQHGTVQVAVTFASSGRVTTANVGPPLAATPAGSCVARAVRSATVAPFSRPTFLVNYPFTY